MSYDGLPVTAAIGEQSLHHLRPKEHYQHRNTRQIRRALNTG